MRSGRGPGKPLRANRSKKVQPIACGRRRGNRGNNTSLTTINTTRSARSRQGRIGSVEGERGWVAAWAVPSLNRLLCSRETATDGFVSPPPPPAKHPISYIYPLILDIECDRVVFVCPSPGFVPAKRTHTGAAKKTACLPITCSAKTTTCFPTTLQRSKNAHKHAHSDASILNVK